MIHTAAQIMALAPTRIVLSPAPESRLMRGLCGVAYQGSERENPTAGSVWDIRRFVKAFGGSIVYAPELMHGKQCVIKADNGTRLFQGLPA